MSRHASPSPTRSPPASSKLEIWIQYKGEIASLMQTTTEPRARTIEEPALLRGLADHLHTLNFTFARPEATKLVWGTGQARCLWVFLRGSALYHRMLDHFRAVARTVENNCPVQTIAGIWFREDARHIKHVKVERYKLPTGTKHYDRDRDLRASPLNPASRYSTNYDVSTKSATATATRDVLPDRDIAISSYTNKRKREDREDRDVGYGYQQSKRTNKGGGGGDTSFPRVHTNSSSSSTSIKTSQPFPHSLPKFILFPSPSPPLPSLTTTQPNAHPPPLGDTQLEHNKTPHTMHLDAHYQLPSLPCHAYRLDLSGVQSELVRTVQMRLVKTGWMLREEKEERRRLERLVEAQSRVAPSGSGSSMSMSEGERGSGGSSGDGSGSTLMDYEEEEAVNTHMWDGQTKKEADADPLQSTIPDEGRYEALSFENEQLRAEVQRLRAELASERVARENSQRLYDEERRLHQEERRLHEEERLLQQQWDFGYVKGISPASVPAIMEAFVRLAQLTDKVMLDGA